MLFWPDLDGEIQHAWIDLDVSPIARLLLSDSFATIDEKREPWHFSAKCRLIAVAADMVRRGLVTWHNWANALRLQAGEPPRQ